MDEISQSRTGTMKMVALIKGAATVQVLVPIHKAIPTTHSIPTTVRGLLLMHTLHGHHAQSTQGTIAPQREMPIVRSLRTRSQKKYESFLLIHMPHLMTRGTRNIARVELQSLPDASPYILALTQPRQKSWKLRCHPMFPRIFMLLRRHQLHTLIRSLFLSNMSNITPHTRIHATGPHLRSYMHPDLITIPIIMPHRQSCMPQLRHRV